MASNTVDIQLLDNVFPTHDQAVLALLSAILNHPDIKNSHIYYPVLLGESTPLEPIRITSARDFSGIELIEPGLTLAVFPLHDDYDQKSSTFTSRKSSKSVVYGDQYLGRSSTPYYGVKCTFNFVVQLYYQDSSFNAPVELLSDVINFDNEETGFYPLTVPAVDSWQYNDKLLQNRVLRLEDRLESRVYTLPSNEDPSVPGTTVKKPTNLKTKEQPYSVESKLGGIGSDISITTLPGERVIRAWMSLLVKVIRSLVYLKPFALRNPTVSMVDYPSTNWYRSSENLVFHTGYCLVSYDLTEADEGTYYTYPKPDIPNPPDPPGPPDPPDPPLPPFPNIKKLVIEDSDGEIRPQTEIDLAALDQQSVATKTVKTERVVYVEPDNEVLVARLEDILREIVVVDGGFF